MSPKLADLAYLFGKAQGVEFNIVSVSGGKAVMNGVVAGDLMWATWRVSAGARCRRSCKPASALSVPLKQTPYAPTLADLGVAFNLMVFWFYRPKGMPAEARDAIAAAIGDVISTEGTKVNGLLNKAFGGPTIIAGDDLQALVEGDFAAAGELMKAASE